MAVNGKTVLITGGGSGIGRALALQLSRRGATVIVCGRTRSTLDGVANESAAEMRIIEADIATAGGRAAVGEAVESLNRPLDVLVNNAGVQYEIDFASHEAGPLRESIESEIAVNLSAPVLLTVELLGHLARPGGIIVNVTSLLALHPKAVAPIYCATKAGLRSFTLSLRHQLSSEGISVVEVVPPLVNTAMTAGRGTRKISPDQAAREIVAGLDKGKTEIRIGRSKMVFILNRLAPNLVANMMIKS